MALVIKTSGFDEYLDPSGGAWIKCLILGEHGSGKTRSSSYWPDPIIAAAEDGLMAVADRAIPFARITTSAEMDQMLEHIRKDSLQPPERRKYRTFVVDTIDAYQRTLVNERLKAERKEALSGWADYGWLAQKTNALIERLQNLPINVVVLMHVKDKEDEQDGASILVKKSALKGEAADTIYRDFDLIGLMENSYVAEDGERVLKRQIRWHSEPRFPMLRDRSGRLPRFTDVDFTPDDYSRIFDTIVADVDNLPATKDYDEAEELAANLEEIQEAEAAIKGAPVPPDVKGGPVANPEVPRPAPAKKTAAKKAAPVAKKAAAAPSVPEQRQSPEDNVAASGGQVTPAPEAVPDDPATAEAEAQKLVEDKLGATPVESEGEPDSAAVAEGQKAAEAAKERIAERTAPEPVEPAAGPVCGSQPPGLVGDPVEGCGVVLTRQNAVRLSMAQLRTKTALCDQCFDNWKKDN